MLAANAMIPKASQRIVLDRFLNHMEAYALFHYLDANGFPVTIGERPLGLAMGEIPFLEITTTLYLDDPARLEEARALMAHYRSGLPGVRGTAWRCLKCGESHEPMFGECWNCGTVRPR